MSSVTGRRQTQVLKHIFNKNAEAKQCQEGWRQKWHKGMLGNNLNPGAGLWYLFISLTGLMLIYEIPLSVSSLHGVDRHHCFLSLIIYHANSTQFSVWLIVPSERLFSWTFICTAVSFIADSFLMFRALTCLWYSFISRIYIRLFTIFSFFHRKTWRMFLVPSPEIREIHVLIVSVASSTELPTYWE